MLVAATDRMSMVYRLLGLSDRRIKAEGSFAEELKQKIDWALVNKEELISQSAAAIKPKKDETIGLYKEYFRKIS